MTNSRRDFLKKTAVLAISSPSVRAEWLAENFSPSAPVLAETPTTSEITDTNKIEIKLPKIAEKGTSIPISVTTSLENVQTIAILVEKNAVPLVAKFRLSEQLESFVSARLVMQETSDIIVLVETRGGIYRAKEQVKIIIGGCGT